jgi:hypothetical protein
VYLDGGPQHHPGAAGLPDGITCRLPIPAEALCWAAALAWRTLRR